jgi:hypothetical protein
MTKEVYDARGVPSTIEDLAGAERLARVRRLDSPTATLLPSMHTRAFLRPSLCGCRSVQRERASDDHTDAIASSFDSLDVYRDGRLEGAEAEKTTRPSE